MTGKKSTPVPLVIFNLADALNMPAGDLIGLVEQRLKTHRR